MQALQHDLVLAGAASSARDALAAALGPGFSVQPEGRPETVRRTWLDTFDWRLHRAGLTLEDATSSGRRDVTLTDRSGEQRAAHTGPVSWPRLAAELPEGPLRSALAPVCGVRALLPVARVVSVTRRMRALNDDDKTVAWLTLDQMTLTPATAAEHAAGRAAAGRAAAGVPAAGSLPPRLTIMALRGYAREADRIRRRLIAAGDLAAPAPPALAGALAAAGRRPRDYTGKIDVELAADMPARTAMAALLLRLLDMLEANVAGTVRDLDTEFLHDLRVAVRRSRSALKLGGSALPASLTRRFLPELKWLGDATTPTRDLDVYLLDFTSMAAHLVAAAPADLEPLHAHLRQQRAAQQRQLAAALRSARFTGLTTSWRAALTGLRPPPRSQPTARFAADIVRQAHRRVVARGKAIGPDSPPEALHDLRKRAKELRYALELFGSLHDPEAHREVVAHLKGLQDCLGEFQDREVQRLELEMFATQMMSQWQVPAKTLLAMGDLAVHLALRQRRARGEFAGRFADFSHQAVGRHLRALTGGGRP